MEKHGAMDLNYEKECAKQDALTNLFCEVWVSAADQEGL